MSDGAIILKRIIVNCEICLHIVSIFCSTEKKLAKWHYANGIH